MNGNSLLGWMIIIGMVIAIPIVIFMPEPRPAIQIKKIKSLTVEERGSYIGEKSVEFTKGIVKGIWKGIKDESKSTTTNKPTSNN